MTVNLDNKRNHADREPASGSQEALRLLVQVLARQAAQDFIDTQNSMTNFDNNEVAALNDNISKLGD